MIDNKTKQTTCEKYRTYLEIIYTFGNKVMLQKQLYEYAEQMNLCTNDNQFYRHIQELKEADILKTEPFIALERQTQLNVIVLKKYAVRFLENKKNSQEVGAISCTQERILLSTFKNNYILEKLIPRLKKNQEEITVANIRELIETDCSSILYNKNQGLSYFTDLYEKLSPQIKFSIQDVESLTNRMAATKENMLKGLEKGAKTSWGKGGRKNTKNESGVDALNAVIERHSKEQEQGFNETVNGTAKESRKELRLRNTTPDTMLNAFNYVAQVKGTKGVLTITLLIFDLYNNADIYKLALNIASAHHMFSLLMPTVEFKLKVGVALHNSVALKLIEEDKKKKTRNFFSKEKNKLSYLNQCLKDNYIGELAQENIEIVFTDYQITDKYMDGIKYKNLKK